MTRIKWAGDAGASPVTVTLADGSALAGDAVVTTFSLGVLKASLGAAAGDAPVFEPPLGGASDAKAAAIREMHIGLVNKVGHNDTC